MVYVNTHSCVIYMKSISKEYSMWWWWWIGKNIAIEMPSFFGCPILASKVTCIRSICHSQSSLAVENFVRTMSPTFVGRICFTLSHMHATEFHSDDFMTNFLCAHSVFHSILLQSNKTRFVKHHLSDKFQRKFFVLF